MSQYFAIADRYAQQYGIDPQLYRRLIQQESGWNPQARSAVGAYGLSQAMPDTARDPGFGVKPLQNLDDPEEQLRFGAEYFAAMQRRYGGNTAKALAAYNWGAGNADKWNGDPNAAPEETRNYINAILGGQAQGGPQGQSNPGMMSFLPSDSPQAAPPQGTPWQQMGDPAEGIYNDPAVRAQYADPEEKPGWISKVAPWASAIDNRDALLAIGSGLLSGDDWASGLGAAGENLLQVRQSERQRVDKRLDSAADHLRSQQREQALVRERAAYRESTARDNAQRIQIEGINPETGQREVRVGTFEGGDYFVFNDQGEKVKAASIYGGRFKTANNSATGDAWGGAGGIPNARSVSENGTPSFDFRNESQGKSYAYARRAIQANVNIERIADTVGWDTMASINQKISRWASQNAEGRITSAVINSILDDEGLGGITHSTMSQFLQAMLRDDTGAAYTGVEFNDYATSFLPSVGDDKATFAAKAASRRQAIGALIGKTGPAAEYLTELLEGTRELPYDFNPVEHLAQPDPTPTPTPGAGQPAPAIPRPADVPDDLTWQYILANPDKFPEFAEDLNPTAPLDQSNGPGILSEPQATSVPMPPNYPWGQAAWDSAPDEVKAMWLKGQM